MVSSKLVHRRCTRSEVSASRPPLLGSISEVVAGVTLGRSLFRLDFALGVTASVVFVKGNGRHPDAERSQGPPAVGNRTNTMGAQSSV